MSSLGKFLLLVLAIYVAFVLLVFLGQRKLMYYPTTQRVQPADAGLSGIDEIVLELANGDRLYSWYAAAGAGQPTLLFFHGNAGAVSHRAHRFVAYTAQGFGVFVLGYPGYGGSDGSPSEKSFVAAAEAAYAFLREQGVAADDIVIYGESIGSGAAVQLAANVDAGALVLEAPMASAVDVASRHYPFLSVSLLLRDSYMSVERVASIDMPLLIIHGTEDRIIPIASGELLFEAAVEPKQFTPIRGAGHNDLQLHPVVDIVRDFLAR